MDIQLCVREIVRIDRLHLRQDQSPGVNATYARAHVGKEILYCTPLIVSRENENHVTLTTRFEFFEGEEKVPRVRQNHQTTSVDLLEFQGYTLFYCFPLYTKYMSYTGSTITSSKPLGVVSGNCYALTNTSFCMDSTRDVLLRTGNIAAEMMAPSRYRGKEYIIPVIPDRKNQGRTIIMSCKARTRVRIYKSVEAFKIRRFRDAGESAILSVSHQPVLVKSDKQIVLAYYQAPLCEGGNDAGQEKVDPALTLIVPNGLFYNLYIWSSLRDAKDIEISNFVIIIVRQEDLKQILFDGLNVARNLTGHPVIGMKDWHLYSLSSSRGTHRLEGGTSKFGCYLYGLGNALVYFHHTGFANIILNKPCNQTLTDMSPGDFVDNDCDRSVDEETFNGLDDDHDRFIDEDLKEPVSTLRYNTTKTQQVQRTRVKSVTTTAKKSSTTRLGLTTQTTTMTFVDKDYYWSEWTDWECTKDCSDSRMVQHRTCNLSVTLKCNEASQRYNPGECYVNVTCPRACPAGTWGLNCVGKCTNCDPDCDKFTGSCRLCKAGFQTPNQSCTSECGPFRYGYDCKEDCMLKCKKDCSERIQGLCPVGLLTRFLPLVLLIPVIPFVVLSLLGQKITNIEDTESLPHAGELNLM